MLNVYIITHIVVKCFPATTISRCTSWIPRSPSTKKLKRKEGKKERKKERKKEKAGRDGNGYARLLEGERFRKGV